MGRPEELFQRLKASGRETIGALIQARANEELFLDFKRSCNNGQGTSLDPKDRAILSKAISGFGNSEGGVLLLGIDCPSERADRAATPQINALEQPGRFCRWILDAVSGCTVPAHPRVEAVAIPENNGKDSGFVAVLIPSSEMTPHQAIPSRQYYMRAGSSFEPVPHAVLAGMFGRRPNSRLYNMYAMTEPEVFVGNQTRFLKMSVGFLLANPGPVQARDLYLNLELFMPNGPSNAKFEVTNPRWTGHQEFGVQMSLVSGDNYRLAPGSKVQPLTVQIALAKPFGSRWRLTQSFGCEGMPHQEHRRELSPEQLNEIWRKYDLDIRTGKLGHDFATPFFPTENVARDSLG